ncbi:MULTISPECIES: ATP-dependent DNA helicase [Haloarcula]|uniref:Helicase n=1 Tax=Haloarcula pellucida TaxID=1427151 RepID=A0A830GQV1_9EURY|nr:MULTISPECIES: ATP-dependent DNA helicase [Halomicroarcula]MBX0349245.1 ATP-dependent DNA helicase [Halomicroarcula pellucida]MDS0279164.1 ATP-dependent DNA helicase [Halomicroarcula sp. S1AR25-4]GGN99685.1 helicase [Halomicroarcula pellucida]
MYPARIHDEFPAPSYRGNQKQALSDIRTAFESGKDVVLVRAPTGSGKSLLARAIAGCARTAGEASAEQVVDAYYTTPQVSQLDDVAEDDLLEDLCVIRGKNNYDCILPGETDTPVNQAPCVREREFDCQVKHRCPYFSDRAIASNRRIAAMTLAYFMQTAGSDVFGKRDVVVVDEAHGLGEWAEMYATIDLSPETIPMWSDLDVPTLDGLDEAVAFAERLEHLTERRVKELRGNAELTPDEVAERDSLNKLRSDLSWFQEDYRDPESATTWVVDQADGEGAPVTIKPMNPERYLKHTVWDRGNKFALLSATILNKDAFCANVGLDPDDVALVEVGHTFPVENRPLYDVTQGKMTYDHRDDTLPKVARKIVRIMAQHPDEKGLIHCHSYAIQEQLDDLLTEFGVGPRVRSHDKADRDGALSAWKRSDNPDVFLSVKMEEALDLEGELCRWQVLCKAPYPNTRDSRVARRLEDGQWGWYYRTALRTVIQACGRVVRAPDDYGATYLADTSLLDLFERARHDMPDWFDEQVVRMSEPELPDFAPDRALSGVSASAKRRHDRSRSRSGGGSHPLSDVWD